MSLAKTSSIIAGGSWRNVFAAYADAARVRARLMRRAHPLLRRANFAGRLVIRYRISRFVRRYIAKRFPPGALYTALALRFAGVQPAR